MKDEARKAVLELLEVANLKEKDLFVIGCSSSEVGGHQIGSFSSTEIADALFEVLYKKLKEKNIYLAVQCCEHLNRALILEEEATAAYREFQNPVAVEAIQAAAGMDIGDTLIGMHLAQVAVPVRTSVKKIGHANLVCARTRLKYIGGERAHYTNSSVIETGQ